MHQFAFHSHTFFLYVMKKSNKERRKERHLKRKANDAAYKKEMWEEGKKLIEPEYSSSGYYPPDYSIELGERLYQIFKSYKDHVIQVGDVEDRNGNGIFSKEERFMEYFRRYKEKIRDFLILYNPSIPESVEFSYLKRLLETYWDEPNLLLERA